MPPMTSFHRYCPLIVVWTSHLIYCASASITVSSRSIRKPAVEKRAPALMDLLYPEHPRYFLWFGHKCSLYVSLILVLDSCISFPLLYHCCTTSSSEICPIDRSYLPSSSCAPQFHGKLLRRQVHAALTKTLVSLLYNFKNLPSLKVLPTHVFTD